MKQKYPRYFTLSKSFSKRHPSSWFLFAFVNEPNGKIKYVKKSGGVSANFTFQNEAFALKAVERDTWVEIEGEEVPFL